MAPAVGFPARGGGGWRGGVARGVARGGGEGGGEEGGQLEFPFNNRIIKIQRDNAALLNLR